MKVNERLDSMADKIVKNRESSRSKCQQLSSSSTWNRAKNTCMYYYVVAVVVAAAAVLYLCCIFLYHHVEIITVPYARNLSHSTFLCVSYVFWWWHVIVCALLCKTSVWYFGRFQCYCFSIIFLIFILWYGNGTFTRFRSVDWLKEYRFHLNKAYNARSWNFSKRFFIFGIYNHYSNFVSGASINCFLFFLDDDRKHI